MTESSYAGCGGTTNSKDRTRWAMELLQGKIMPKIERIDNNSLYDKGQSKLRSFYRVLALRRNNFLKKLHVNYLHYFIGNIRVKDYIIKAHLLKIVLSS